MGLTRVVTVCALLGVGCSSKPAAPPPASEKASPAGPNAAPAAPAAPAAAAPSSGQGPAEFGTLRMLINSRWRLDNGGKVYNIDFLPGGKILSHDPRGRSNDEWELNGKAIKIWINNRFVSLEGEWTDPLTMGGAAVNQKGKRWAWRATRVLF